jgi:hypothetical protein
MRNLDVILNKAAEKRAKEKRVSLAKNNTIPKNIVKAKADSFRVFNKLFYHYYHSFHWVIIGIAVMIVAINMYSPFIGWTKSNVLLFPVALVTIAVIWMPIFFIILMINYYPYKRFVNSSPFPVLGWESINEPDNFPKYRYWTATTFTIIFKDGAPHDLINDALYLLSKNLDKCYYSTGDPYLDGSNVYKDYRKKWQSPKKEKSANTASIYGHANSKVCWKIYRFTNGLLKDINKKYDKIESVEITFSNETYRLSARSSGANDGGI